MAAPDNATLEQLRLVRIALGAGVLVFGLVVRIAIGVVRYRAAQANPGSALLPSFATSRWLAWLPKWLQSAAVLSNRYLGRSEPISLQARIPIIAMLVVFLVALGASEALRHVTDPNWIFRVNGFQMGLRITRFVDVVLLLLFFIFQELRARMSLFSTISTGGLFLGTAAMVLVLSVMSGFELDLRTKIIGMHAHITIDREGLETDGAFEDYARVAELARKDRDVLGASPYLSDEVVVSSPSSSAAVVLKGIDLASIETTSELGKKLDIGELALLGDPERLRDYRMPANLAPPDSDDEGDVEARKAFEAGRKDGEAFEPAHGVANPPDPAVPRRTLPGLLIGRELARSLRVYIGDEVDLVSPQGGIGPTGAIPKSKSFRIAGEFYTGMLEYDSKYAFVSLPVAQKFTDRPDEVTGVELRLKDGDATEGVIARLGKALGPTYSVRDWKELNRGLFAALKLEKILMFVALSFIVLVAAFSIIANGVVLVFEKKREIAMLRAMGMSTRSVVMIFLLMGLSIGVIGIALGVLIGVGGAMAVREWGFDLLGNRDVYYLTQLPVRIDPAEIIVISLACFGLVLGATIYPAVLGARMLPADGVRR